MPVTTRTSGSGKPQSGAKPKSGQKRAPEDDESDAPPKKTSAKGKKGAESGPDDAPARSTQPKKVPNDELDSEDAPTSKTGPAKKGKTASNGSDSEMEGDASEDSVEEQTNNAKRKCKPGAKSSTTNKRSKGDGIDLNSLSAAQRDKLLKALKLADKKKSKETEANLGNSILLVVPLNYPNDLYVLRSYSIRE